MDDIKPTVPSNGGSTTILSAVPASEYSTDAGTTTNGVYTQLTQVWFEC